MDAETRVLTPRRASVRVTYGSQKPKTQSASYTASQRLATTQHETSKLTPKKRRDLLIDDEEEDDDYNSGQRGIPSAKKRLVQTSLFSGSPLKSSKMAIVSNVETKQRQESLDMIFPELSSSGKPSTAASGLVDSDNWTIPARKTPRSKGCCDKASLQLVHDTAPSKKEQTFLDFGQKPLGSEPCKVCGMAFQRGRADDENLHNKFHRSWQQKQARLLSWDIMSRSAEDKTQTETVLYRDPSKQQASEAMATIVLVDPQCCSNRETQRALAILNIANDHLGAVKLSSEDLAQSQRKILLYVSPKGFVQGCILAEMISSARRVAIEYGTQNVESAVQLLDSEETAVCGISRIWVASDARRRGVASQMINALCRQFVYGCQLSRDALAFTQPTSDGRALAEKVFGRRDFLVYIED